MFDDPTNPTGRYILDEHGDPKEEPDLVTWANWLETSDREVRRTYVGPCLVSTVFLGLDHSFMRTGPPVLWETMIFSGAFGAGDYQDRYTSRVEAARGHAVAVFVAERFGDPPRRLKKALRRVHDYELTARTTRWKRFAEAYLAGHRVKPRRRAIPAQAALVKRWQARVDAYRAHLEASLPPALVLARAIAPGPLRLN